MQHSSSPISSRPSSRPRAALYTLLGSVLLLGATALTAPLARADDLYDVFQRAKQADPQFQAAQAARDSALQAKPEARSQVLPSVGLSGSVTRNRSDITATSFGLPRTSTFTSKTYSLNLDQVLYNHDYFAQLRQADYQVAQAESQFQTARQGLIIRVVQAYFAVLSAQDNLHFAQAEKKAIGQQLDQAQQRFKVGLTAITDVREAQARYDQSTAQEIAAKNQLAVSKESLREIIGGQVPSLAGLSDQLPLVTPQPNDIKSWVDAALDNNPQLIVAEKASDVAKEQIERAKAGHYPTLNLVASHSYTDTGGLFTRTETDDAVGIQLNMPIYQGGGISARVQQATYQYRQSKDQLEQTRRATERQARSAYLNVISGISAVKARKQALKSTQTALEATQAGYEVGTRTQVDVLNAQQALYGAERDYAQARYDYITNTLILRQATGSLTADDLQRISRWLK